MTNRSTTVKSQSLKQKVLRFMYPLIRKLGKKGKNGTVLLNEHKRQPLTSLHNLKIDLNTGKKLDLQEFKGKKLILVNTASNCGYTGQYSELQSLQEHYGNTLQVIAFPANDFAEQEKSDDNEIAEFCQMNYGVTFPVAKKGVVVKNEEQQDLFKWLTNKDLNGWNQHAPDWNFSKYIVDENGILTHYFGPSISPLEEQFLRALE
ncbi:glutathione peroxidase [Salinimicrobium sp. WS361]|uniref:glutathione peroxidase n=1 Tax=Salinimicrobium sp. WS361 TaxID=3425123 RepID=UPI003D6FD740